MKHQGMMTVASDRTYDGMDPLAEIYYQASTFAYVENSPMGRIDPDGRAWTSVNWAPVRNRDGSDYEDRFKRFSTAFEDFGAPPVNSAAAGSGSNTKGGEKNKNDDGGDKGEMDFSNSNMALTVGGAIYGGLEGASASQGYWLGNNGKYYPQQWGGNQYTGSRSGALNVANNYRLAGRGVVGVSAILGATSTYQGYVLDGGEFGYNAQRAAVGSAGGIAGGVAGAKGGALIGAGIGAWFVGVGAIPGGVIGGVIGGGILGGHVAEKAVGHYHKP